MTPDAEPRPDAATKPVDFDGLAKALQAADGREAKVDAFLRFCDRDPESAGIFDRRTVDFHLSTVYPEEREHPTIAPDKAVIAELAPAAFNIGEPELARRMVDALDNETSKAYGYRRLFLLSGHVTDAERYLDWSRQANPSCLSAQVHIGKAVDRFASREEMLADVIAVAQAAGFDHVAREAQDSLPAGSEVLVLERVQAFAEEQAREAEAVRGVS